MEDSELAIINESVGAAIKIHVNGKIDAVHKMLEHQNETMGKFVDKVDKHLEVDAEFKRRVEPVVQAFEDNALMKRKVENVGKMAIFGGKVVTAIGVIILGIQYAVTHFKV